VTRPTLHNELWGSAARHVLRGSSGSSAAVALTFFIAFLVRNTIVLCAPRLIFAMYVLGVISTTDFLRVRLVQLEGLEKSELARSLHEEKNICEIQLTCFITVLRNIISPVSIILNQDVVDGMSKLFFDFDLDQLNRG
jgi:hypothetical protein